MVRNYSKFAAEAATAASPSPAAAEFKVPRPNLKPASPTSSSSSSKNKGTLSDGDRAAFEAELANGRSKLKKVRKMPTRNLDTS